MAGYYGYSMSNNAVDAYESGEKPLSKWTKAEIIKNAIPYLNCDLDLFKKLTVKQMRHICLYETSWHHTSNWYNKTSFYSIDEEMCSTLSNEEVQSMIDRQRKEVKPTVIEYKAKCKFLEWSGSRNHPKATERIEVGTIKGNWFYREDGNKKSINANGFKIMEVMK